MFPIVAAPPVFNLGWGLEIQAFVPTGQGHWWDTVLMIQANTMLMYPLQEAIDLLSNKLKMAKKNLEETVEDLEWLREQSTVMEVNFARVHNVS